MPIHTFDGITCALRAGGVLADQLRHAIANGDASPANCLELSALDKLRAETERAQQTLEDLAAVLDRQVAATSAGSAVSRVVEWASYPGVPLCRCSVSQCRSPVLLCRSLQRVPLCRCAHLAASGYAASAAYRYADRRPDSAAELLRARD